MDPELPSYLSRPRFRRAFSSDIAALRARTELAREKDVYRYLYTWANLHQPAALNRHAFPASDEHLHEPEPGGDVTLAAFAQLSALRLNARRALVSLVSSGTEYVLAEATRTMSLQYDTVEDAKDRPWLGSCSFPRSDGLNDFAVDAWRKARRYRELPEVGDMYYQEGMSGHWLVISDAKNNAEYNNRAFVSRSSDLRFFCSVPLRDMTGSVIGALSVMDDKPRYGVSAAEMLLLEDSADTITAHLDSLVVRSRQQRSERLIQALGLFNDQKSSLREWWIGQDRDRTRQGGRYHENKERNVEEQKARVDKEFGVQQSELPAAMQWRLNRENSASSEDAEGIGSLPPTVSQTNANAANAREQEGVSGSDFDTRPSRSLQEQPDFQATESKQRTTNSGPDKKDDRHNKAKAGTEIFDLAQSVKGAYARASNLICEAMRVEGVVFIDAKAASATLRPKRSSRGSRVSSSAEQSSTPPSDGLGNSPSEGSNGSEESNPSRLCSITGFSTRSRSTLSGSSTPRQFALGQDELRRYLKRYPKGKVFNFAESGGIYSSSGEDPGPGSSGDNDNDNDSQQQDLSSKRMPRSRASKDATRLGKTMIGARSIAFFPILDDSSENYRSAVFVWSTTPLRYFDAIEDMTYISAFAHSLTAELARLQTLASDKAKATFISSISHELRSPLHGVLAGAELLQETELSRFQSEMTSTISMAGRTLLDTVNHVLDFSKMSSRPPGGKRTSSRESDIAPVDLARLLEDTMESVVSAHRFQRLMTSNLPGDSIFPAALSKGPLDSAGDNVTVVLNIEKRENWVANISRGSFTRVVTNLVGNSLKYTESGTVIVSLRAKDTTSDTMTMELVVQDTGIGMSDEFLAHGLFIPYRQADSNTTGTGLGFSIVKQIAKDLRATLDVQSELKKGTRVAMHLAVSPAQLFPEDVDALDERLVGYAAQTKPRDFHLFTVDPDSQHTSSPESLAIGRSTSSTASQWLRCTASFGQHWNPQSHNSVCAIAEDDLTQLVRTQPEAFSATMTDLARRKLLLVVLGRNLHSTSPSVVFEDFSIKPIYVHQPIGPRKLLRAIKAGEDSYATSNPGRLTRQDSSLPSTPFIVRANSVDLGALPPNQAPSKREGQGGGLSIRTLSREPSIPSRPQTPGSLLERTSSAASSAIVSPRDDLAAGDAVEPVDRDTVLLVEDNAINMKLLKVLMEKLSLQYDTADDGAKALDMVTARPCRYFLILTDISMPVMDGNEATARIRDLERRRRLPKTPIVAISGVSNEESKKASFASGVDQYFTKPIKMRDISNLVAEIKQTSSPQAV